MNCFVYKSEQQHDYYLYLGQAIEQVQLPESLLSLLGELALVVEFELHAEKTLAQVEAKQVLADIARQGYFLQMPKIEMCAQ